jgi:PAS domain-containing protein
MQKKQTESITIQFKFFTKTGSLAVLLIQKRRDMLMYEDLREGKQAEEALKENELQYRNLFNSASDAIFTMDEDRFIDCNIRTLEIVEGSTLFLDEIGEIQLNMQIKLLSY